MTDADLDQVEQSFIKATRVAYDAGVRLLTLHSKSMIRESTCSSIECFSEGRTMNDIIVDGVPKIGTELPRQAFEGCVRKGHH